MNEFHTLSEVRKHRYQKDWLHLVGWGAGAEDAEPCEVQQVRDGL